MAKTLELSFNVENGGDAKISIRNPKDSLTPAEIKAAMQEIIQSNVFVASKGSFVSVKSARVVDRTTQDIVLP